MWGIIPAAGLGSRIQPLAFSKELLPVGSRMEAGIERPRAVSEHLIERMIAGGVDRICFVIAPGKCDILNYYGSRIGGASIAYVVQQEPSGLCDAIFCALPLIRPDDRVVVGLPDTIWFPEAALAPLPDNEFSFLLFPVEHPEFFDAVVTDATGRVETIEVKRPGARNRWIWGAFKLPGAVLHELNVLWREPGRGDEYIGTLVNTWLARGGQARGVRGGEVYVDVGTLNGYREAVSLLANRPGPQESNVVPFRVLQQQALLLAAVQRPDLATAAVNKLDGAGRTAGV
jgi:glucose-1-phosphate thymidylyltransferase